MKAMITLTREGYIRLVDRFIYLSHVIRPRLLEEMQDLRPHRNVEYREVRERLDRLQSSIAEIEEIITQSEILVGWKSYCKRAYMGATVTLKNTETGVSSTYLLVGPHESDIPGGRLSSESPLGTALIGHQEGDEVLVETPSGIKTYRITSVRW